MTQYSGECSCGLVTFTCQGEPLFTQYCHCNKCREVASLSKRENDKIGYAFTAAYLTSNFKIITGSECLHEKILNHSKLFQCQSCQSLIYGISTDPLMQSGIGINVNNIKLNNRIPDTFKPVRHIWYVNRIRDFSDDLPKFKDAPKDQLGSGERVEDLPSAIVKAKL